MVTYAEVILLMQESKPFSKYRLCTSACHLSK